MGHQTSHYSLCIYVAHFTFYMVSATFYMVNFLLFILDIPIDRVPTSDQFVV